MASKVATWPDAPSSGVAYPSAEPAPAKINLYLHILGRCQDGYHELQSLVMFADAGDEVIALGPQADWSLHHDGPFSRALEATSTEDNLILRAARRFAVQCATASPMALRLGKRLPLAAGIGGGSADAAATLRLLSRIWQRGAGEPEDWADLGADIPVCLVNRPALVEGMGERVNPVSNMPDLPAVLINPGVPSPTGAVFHALAGRFGAPFSQPTPPPGLNVQAMANWLAPSRNDLTEPATAITPAIRQTLNLLAESPDVLLARMSGSGSTCFGLYPTQEQASVAASWLAHKMPGAWVASTILRGSSTSVA